MLPSYQAREDPGLGPRSGRRREPKQHRRATVQDGYNFLIRPRVPNPGTSAGEFSRADRRLRMWIIGICGLSAEIDSSPAGPQRGWQEIKPGIGDIRKDKTFFQGSRTRDSNLQGGKNPQRELNLGHSFSACAFRDMIYHFLDLYHISADG